MVLAHGHRGAVHDRQHRQQHRDVLRPGAAKQMRAEAEVRQAHDREHAGLDDRDRVQQRGDRRRRDGGTGQPGVHREDGRLHAEARKRAQVADAQQQRMLAGERLGEHAAHHERAAVAERDDDHHAHERDSRAEEGIDHVHPAGRDALAARAVHDQRDRRQRQELIEDVHRHDVRRRGDTQRHAVGDRIEREEVVFAALMLHVFKAIEHGQRPQERHQRREDAAQSVDDKGNGHVLHEHERDRRGLAAMGQAEEHDQGRDDRHALHRPLALRAGFGRDNQHRQARDDRKKYRKAKHRHSLLTGSPPQRTQSRWSGAGPARRRAQHPRPARSSERSSACPAPCFQGPHSRSRCLGRSR